MHGLPIILGIFSGTVLLHSRYRQKGRVLPDEEERAKIRTWVKGKYDEAR